MRSHVAVTYEIDDIDAAAQELIKKGLEGFPLEKNTIGILFCYSDMDVQGLVSQLQGSAGFEIIGCTCIASMDDREGFHDMAATLLVLTSAEHTFAAVASAAIHPENVQAQVEETYSRARDQLGAPPSLLFALPPYILEIMLDAYSNAFNAVAPGVPVVGGLPSYNASGDTNLTFAGGEAWPDRLVMLAIAGPLKPVFSVQNVISNDAQRKRKVTRAKDNVVYEVGEQRFTDYLREIGLPVEKLTQGNNTITFVSNPLLLEKGADAEGSDYSFARTLHEINLEEGSGTAIGEIPSGATLSVCTLQRDEIEQAALAGVRDLKEKMASAQSSGYAYSTVLAVSCIGRHLLMLPNNDAETKQILADFPSGLSLSGFYSYGELGPQGSGQQRIFAHNESLVLCAF